MNEGAKLDYRTFAADDAEASANWLRGVRMGFYEAAATQAQLEEFLRGYQLDSRSLTGVYDHAQGAGALTVNIPVATYATMTHTLNTGHGNLLPAHQITAVTVRSTHRRRGILRELITQDLTKARENGFALAALTASEAVIYGRFGFGPATFLQSVEVDAGTRFAMRAPVEGAIEVIDPGDLADLSAEIFGRFHGETFGSMDRQYAYPQRASGRWSTDKPEPDPSVRAAVYRSANGSCDGYVSYRFDGWDTTPATVSIQDLVAATPAAYRELWRFLGSMDLIAKVKAPMAPAADPLPWLLQDMRAYRVNAVYDHLWLRILDPVKALSARHWLNDGIVTFTVQDPLRLADGTFRLEVAGGSASVVQFPGIPAQGENPAGEDGPTTGDDPTSGDRPTAGEDKEGVDIDLDAAALASLYLGGTGDIVGSLLASGSIRELREGAAAQLRHLFVPPSVPYCITGF